MTKLWTPPTEAEIEQSNRDREERARLFSSDEFAAFKAGYERGEHDMKHGRILLPYDALMEGYFLKYKGISYSRNG